MSTIKQNKSVINVITDIADVIGNVIINTKHEIGINSNKTIGKSIVDLITNAAKKRTK